jgi:glycosyltransferase involved in cell wall biosynthesis
LSVTPLNPRVSVGLPVCNGQRYLADALASLISQSYSALEIVLSDNASDDRTPDICREFERRDPRIIYSRTDHRLDIADNWNRAFRLSSGELFLWAAHDDLWEPEYVARLVERIDRDPSASFALARFDMIDGEGKVIVPGEECRFEDFCSTNLYRRLLSFLASEFMGKGNAVHGLMRREALTRVRGASSFQELLVPGDWLLIFRLLCAGHFVYDDELLFHKRDRYQKSTHRPVQQQLVAQYREARDYRRFARTIHAEILMLEELSPAQKADLWRVGRTQVARLYQHQLEVLIGAARRRLSDDVSQPDVDELPI